MPFVVRGPLLMMSHRLVTMRTHSQMVTPLVFTICIPISDIVKRC